MADSGEKRFPSQDPALAKARREIKQLEGSLHEQDDLIERLRKENSKLKKENEKLKKELATLRQPPKWAKPSKTEEEKKWRKKKGPKYGHKANVRKRPDRVDREVNLVPKHCPHCDEELPEPHKWHHHRQIDLPPPSRPIVTQYNMGWCWCARCQKAVSSKEKLSGSLYGPMFHAMVTYWHFSLGLTFGKIEELLREQYGLDVSRGQLSELVSRSASEFNGAYEDLRTSLLDQPFIYADETGWREDGKSRWLWSFSNSDLSYYVIDKSRGSKVVNEVLGESYSGILSSDFYNAYNKIDCEKQKCWAHVLREVHKLEEKYPKSSEILRYGKRLHRFYERGVLLQGEYRPGRDVDKRLKRLKADTGRFLFRRRRHKGLKRLSKRLVKYRGELYAFIKTGVDPTNNHAEREIRPAVLMRKISYGNRSEQGSDNQAILMSVIRTAQKRNLNFASFAADYMIRRNGADPPPLVSPPTGN